MTFGKKKTTTQERADAQKQPQQRSAPQITAHTMADDLAAPAATDAQPVQQQAAPAAPQAETPTETKSPFLGAAPSAEHKQPAPHAADKRHSSHPTTKRHTSGVGLGTMIGLMMLVIIMIIAWFAWKVGIFSGMQKRIDTIAPSQQTASETAAAPQGARNGAAEVRVSAPLQHTDGRFPTADTAWQLGAQATTAAVMQRVREMVAQDTTATAHTVDIVDESGAPMTFATFARRFLPTIPASVTQTLTEPFQLYILPQGGEYRVGIHTYTTDPDGVRSALRQAETTLIKGLSPLFLFDAPPVQNAVFDDSSYKNIPIRFYNFRPDATASVDYVTHYDHVFFGTSRPTMHAMMDIVFAHDAAQQAQAAGAPQPVAPATGPDPAQARPPAAAASAQTTEAAAAAPGATESSAATTAQSDGMDVEVQ